MIILHGLFIALHGFSISDYVDCMLTILMQQH